MNLKNKALVVTGTLGMIFLAACSAPQQQLPPSPPPPQADILAAYQIKNSIGKFDFTEFNPKSNASKICVLASPTASYGGSVLQCFNKSSGPYPGDATSNIEYEINNGGHFHVFEFSPKSDKGERCMIVAPSASYDGSTMQCFAAHGRF